SGMEILAYCIMSNHFHVLIRVRSVPEAGLSRDELLHRYRLLYETSNSVDYPDADRMSLILAREDEEAARWERRLRLRMGDVSDFMKTLKQRFSVWYNRSRGRFGTLWAERFRSIIVQDDSMCLQTVAAYIDLNPVRA